MLRLAFSPDRGRKCSANNPSVSSRSLSCPLARSLSFRLACICMPDTTGLCADMFAHTLNCVSMTFVPKVHTTRCLLILCRHHRKGDHPTSLQRNLHPSKYQKKKLLLHKQRWLKNRRLLLQQNLQQLELQKMELRQMEPPKEKLQQMELQKESRAEGTDGLKGKSILEIKLSVESSTLVRLFMTGN